MRQSWVGVVCVVFGAAVVAAAGGLGETGWDRSKAFEFLETRQREWAAWPPAQKPGGPCISCHSGLSYMFARRALEAPAPGEAERALLAGVTLRALATPPTRTMPDPGAEAVLNLLTMALQRRDPGAAAGDAERAALGTLLDRQIRDGAAKGSWTWVDAELDPFDAAHSTYFGTALAVLALSAYPGVPAGPVAQADAYLRAALSGQPLHNQLAYLAFVPARDVAASETVLQAAWRAQSPDGGWTTASMGPWLPHSGQPPDSGSNAYVTSWAAFALQRGGVPCGDTRLARALDWLERRQARASGAWRAPSMNKVYPPRSIQEGFMTDAATGFAAAALTACGR